MSPRLTLAEVTVELGLHDWEQDWGLCNADPARLAEFTAYYRRVLGTHRVDRVEHALGELLLQSANDVLRVDGPTPAVSDALRLIAERRHTSAVRHLLAYWLELDRKTAPAPGGGFPVSAHLRKVLQRDG